MTASAFPVMGEAAPQRLARGAERIRSTVLTGFWMRRSWLDPATLPDVETCLAEIAQA